MTPAGILAAAMVTPAAAFAFLGAVIVVGLALDVWATLTGRDD